MEASEERDNTVKIDKPESKSRFFGGVSAFAHSVGGSMKSAANAVGNATSSAASAVASTTVSAANAVGSATTSAASAVVTLTGCFVLGLLRIRNDRVVLILVLGYLLKRQTEYVRERLYYSVGNVLVVRLNS